MNTNGNTYTVLYTALIVAVVAAILAFASQKLKPMQNANIKAETISQMLNAAQFETEGLNNQQKLAKYAEEIQEAFTVDANGAKVADLSVDVNNIELVDNLKPINKAIKAGSKDVTLPVYKFKNGSTVVPVYGAGLWGPIWGYVAVESDGKTIAGAYFDHESETPGLGAKIKDEPWFREQFVGKKAAFGQSPVFAIVKGGAPEGQENAVDAITGATMTSKGLDEAINVWLNAYAPYFGSASVEEPATAEENVEPVENVEE